LTNEEFEKEIENALPLLPDEFKQLLDNIEIAIEDRPDKEMNKKLGIGRGGMILGIYTGVPLPLRGTGFSVQQYNLASPDRIILYKKNIEEMCRSGKKRLREQIRETLFHEIGHYLGLGEDEVRNLRYRAMK
jgi:predicted Zn-dependent protease with MMP-like domain